MSTTSSNSLPAPPTLWCKDEYLETHQGKLTSFVEATVLGSIITCTPDSGIQVNQIPFTVHRHENADGAGSPKVTLQCHFPCKNETQLKALLEHPDSQVVVAFNGSNHYISANWYPSKFKTHRRVPTWNYATVNATVKVKNSSQSTTGFLTSATAPPEDKAQQLNNQHRANLAAHLTQLSQYCEELVGEKQPWKLSEAPSAYLDILYQGLCWIEFEVVQLEGKMKASQNNPEDVHGVIAGLTNLVDNPHNYKHGSNANGQCPLTMRKFVQDNGLTTGPGAGKLTGGGACSEEGGCPFAALANNGLLVATVVFGLVAVALKATGQY